MKIKNWMRQAALKLAPPNYEGKHLKTKLKGGLCNKLLCLSSACDIALEKKCTLIEPDFGWHRKILFSDIYDLDYFNKVMSQYNDGNDLIVSSKDLVSDQGDKKKIRYNRIELWEYSEKKIRIERAACKISKDSSNLKLLKALKLRPEYEHLVSSQTTTPFTAIQVRTEPDWVKYAQKKDVADKETLLIDLDTLVKMTADFNPDGKLFFTSGDNHNEISAAFKSAGFSPFSFYNPELEYEINAAINFEICCQALAFIGLSRSSYSNLISLKRAAILNNDNSFIYNFNNEILRRIDKGLQPVAKDSLNKKTTIS